MDIISFLREIGKYFKKNIVVTIFFFITILIGATNIFGQSNQPAHKCWVLSSFVFTSGYTLVFYIFGRKNGYFKNLGGDKSVVIILVHLLLFVITLFIANDYFSLFRLSPGRLLTLILMFIFALLFSIVNWALHQHFHQKSNSIEITGRETQDELEDLEAKRKLKNRYSDQSRSFRSAVFMSDLPLAIAFLVLAIYSIFINHCSQLDYFFSGAIAFQMMASNAVWIFNDDKIFEKL